MKKPKEEWAINKTPKLIQVQNVMSEQSAPQNDDAEDSLTTTPLTTATQTINSPPFTWMGYQLSRSGFLAVQTGSEMRNWILLDSQSSVDLLCNPALVTDIPRLIRDRFLLQTRESPIRTQRQWCLDMDQSGLMRKQ